MDGGSSINILYADSLKQMGISESKLLPSNTTFHGIMLGKYTKPLGPIALEVVFGYQDNFRVEALNFEVVHFKSA